MGLGHWKLLRALGAVAADPAAAADLGLPSAGTTGHDEVFTVNCPPYASLYAGDDQGRLAAFWAAAGRDPPAEPDHLAVLLDGYAGLDRDLDLGPGGALPWSRSSCSACSTVSRPTS